MPRYEVLTPLSNGRGKPPHPPGSVVELEPDEAAALVSLGALRPVDAVVKQQTGGQIAQAIKPRKAAARKRAAKQPAEG